jgi:hypothetical protein
MVFQIQIYFIEFIYLFFDTKIYEFYTFFLNVDMTLSRISNLYLFLVFSF